MAKLSNENIFVNIKELPQIGGIEPGDLLIVETEDGTNILDFDDLIIDTYQTTFYSVLTGNDLAIENSITDLTNDLNDLTATVNQLGGTAFNSLSSQISANTQSITGLQADVNTINIELSSINSDITTINAVLTTGGIRAYGYVQLNATTSTGPTTFVVEPNADYNVQGYQYVTHRTSIPIVGAISPFVRIWNIIFKSGIDINYVDVQMSNIVYSQSRRFDVSQPTLSAGVPKTYFVTVSTQGPGTTDVGFKVRFSAF